MKAIHPQFTNTVVAQVDVYTYVHIHHTPQSMHHTNSPPEFAEKTQWAENDIVAKAETVTQSDKVQQAHQGVSNGPSVIYILAE